MSKIPVYLYPNVYEVVLDLEPVKEVYQVMYRRTIEIQKGLRNTVQLQFKNSDQKFLNVSSSTFSFVMFDATEQVDLIELPVEIIDDGATLRLRGLGQVVFSERDTLDLRPGYYQFAIKQLASDGSYEPTYADTYYTVAGEIILKNDMEPRFRPSQSITSFQQIYNGTDQRYEWYSGNIKAHPELQGVTGLQTMALYMTAYRGQVIIEGTLENSPGFFANYSTITTLTYNQFTGLDYFNFNGRFSHVRIRYIPDANPITQENDDTGYSGTFDKLLYRS